jgi:hypothetical protein
VSAAPRAVHPRGGRRKPSLPKNAALISQHVLRDTNVGSMISSVAPQVRVEWFSVSRYSHTYTYAYTCVGIRIGTRRSIDRSIGIGIGVSRCVGVSIRRSNARHTRVEHSAQCRTCKHSNAKS